MKPTFPVTSSSRWRPGHHSFRHPTRAISALAMTSSTLAAAALAPPRSLARPSSCRRRLTSCRASATAPAKSPEELKRAILRLSALTDRGQLLFQQSAYAPLDRYNARHREEITTAVAELVAVREAERLRRRAAGTKPQSKRPQSQTSPKRQLFRVPTPTAPRHEGREGPIDSLHFRLPCTVR